MATRRHRRVFSSSSSGLEKCVAAESPAKRTRKLFVRQRRLPVIAVREKRPSSQRAAVCSLRIYIESRVAKTNIVACEYVCDALNCVDKRARVIHAKPNDTQTKRAHALQYERVRDEYFKYAASGNK